MPTAPKPVMVLERLPVEDLLADPRNARLHPPRNIETIRFSLRKYGQQKNVVVDKEGALIAGSGTLHAARAEGWTHLDVKRFDGTPEEARAYGIIDNRSGEQAEWDEEILAGDLAVLSRDLIPPAAFTDEEIAALAAPDEPYDSGHEETYRQRFEVIVECRDEADQRAVYEALTAEGRECRVNTL